MPRKPVNGPDNTEVEEDAKEILVTQICQSRHILCRHREIQERLLAAGQHPLKMFNRSLRRRGAKFQRAGEIPQLGCCAVL